MKKDLPLYEIGIDLTDPETKITFNSLVKQPAHEKMFETFEKVERQYFFNDEEQTITGVMIACDVPIYRFNKDTKEEYYVQFSKQSIKDIVLDMAQRQTFNSVNIEHNSKEIVNDIFMTMIYVIDEANGFTAPERFKDESDGTAIASYKCLNADVYEQAKAGDFKGFSIEGVFALYETGATYNGFKADPDEFDLLILELNKLIETL
jgi:hypothetical protein